MSRKHENLLRAIFQDPVGGNIQWREVESLLHHLGATTEPLAKARLRVKLNGVEGTLHRPHHGDALGRQDILHIRPRQGDAFAIRGDTQGGAVSSERGASEVAKRLATRERYLW